MRFEILHEIEYEYSRPVYLEPHIFFIKPREDTGQKIFQFDLIIDPQPAMSSWQLDAFGNVQLRAWFREMSKDFKIKVRSEVETSRENPFDYLLDSSCLGLPVRYLPQNRRALQPYLPQEAFHPSIEAFSEKIAALNKDNTLAFLMALCREIYSGFTKIHRAQGDPWPAHRTLELREGACRDFAILFMECCRAQGIAARFTSGYYEGDSMKPEKEMHAWAEVYLEGGGWRGFDPSAGIAVGENHVSIASSSLPGLVSPVQGAWRGTGVTSTMTTMVRMFKKPLVTSFSES